MQHIPTGDKTGFRAYGRRQLRQIAKLGRLSEADVRAMEVVSAVLPFRVNAYVIEELIDWSRVPDDPIFQLTFPQREMLDTRDFARIEGLMERGASQAQITSAAREIQRRLNPHPAAQREANVPEADGLRLAGMQHKYRDTVLFFPRQGQTCHAYCSYCFRWPQFTGGEDRFANSEAGELADYVRRHSEVSSVLFTGGDPLIMRASLLERYVEPLLDPALSHLSSIRLGSKAMAYWPERFLSERDADALLSLFERIVRSGRALAIMAHYSHPRELETPSARSALSRILSTGAVVRCQAPIVRHVNDSAQIWAELWRRQVQLGAVPYYMFVARDTGAQRYFEVPLTRAHDIYREALSLVSGLERTARGPCMSCTPGKIVVDGPATVAAEQVLVLRFLQARDPSWVGRPFFARHDAQANWFDQLRPAFGEARFFFEDPTTGPSADARRRRLPLADDGVAA